MTTSSGWRRLSVLSLAAVLLAAGCTGDNQGGGGTSPTTGAGGASPTAGETAGETPGETAGETGGASPTEGGGGAEGTIQVMSLWGGSEQEAFQEVLDAFAESTNCTAEYESVRQTYADVLRQRIAGGNPPDVAIIPGIGFLRSFVRDEQIRPLSELGINRADIEGNYAPGILDVGTIDGELYAPMVKLNSKSTVWYRPDRFEELGFETPETWDAFKQLATEINAEGTKALGLGAADSWTLTDWFESIYLRQAGPEMYDQLFSGELPWTDQSVADAVAELQAVLTEENVAGGINAALGRGFVDGIAQVFSENPEALMYYEGGFVGGIATGQVNTSLEPGDNIDWFPFPSIGDQENVVTIGGDVIGAFTTEPCVAEFMQFMTTAEAGQVWAETGAIVSPHTGVDASVYPTELVQREAEQVANAEAVRFDGSDLLPAGGPDLGAELQRAIRGEQIDWESFEQQVQGAWENERGG